MEGDVDLPQCRTTLCCAALLSLVLHKDPLTLSAEKVLERTLLFKKRMTNITLKLFFTSLLETQYNVILNWTTNLCCYLD